MVCGAWSAALCLAVVVAPRQPLVGAAALLLAVPAAGVGVLIRPIAVGLAIAAALAGIARAELPSEDAGIAARAALLAGRTVVLAGAALDDPRPAAAGYQVLVEVHRLTDGTGAPLSGVGSILVRARGITRIAFGDEVAAVGRLRLPDERPGFDRRAYLAQRHVWLELAATQVRSAPGAWSVAAVPSQLRSWYQSALHALVPEPHSAVLLGLVLGIRTGIPQHLEQDLVATGLVHLLVLSGLKVAVFARLASAALTPLLRRWSLPPLIGLVSLYAMTGGATPASIRAAAMGALVLVGTRLGRPSHVWTSFAVVAAAMLAWQPDLAWDIGFELSFVGTAAIVVLTPGIESRLQWLPRLLREPFAVTCAAQVGTVPLMVSGFHLLSPVAPLSNALVIPLLPLLVGGGLLLAPLALVPAVGQLAAVPLVALLMYLEQVAGLLARVPMAAIPLGGIPAWLGAAYYSALAALLVALRTAGGRRLLALAAAVGLPLAIAGGEIAAWQLAPPAAAVLDVGDGQAVLLSGPGGRILIDGGPDPKRLASALGERLPPWQNRLDALIVTAPGLAHVGGLTHLDWRADVIVLPATDLPGAGMRRVAAAVALRGTRIVRAGAGDTLRLAGMTVEVLSPEPGVPEDQPGAADMALRVTTPGGRSFCDLSDLDPEALLAVALRLRGPCDYLLLPDQARSAPPAELLARARPQVLLSSGRASPARAVPEALLRRTAQEGTISLPMR